MDTSPIRQALSVNSVLLVAPHAQAHQSINARLVPLITSYMELAVLITALLVHSRVDSHAKDAYQVALLVTVETIVLHALEPKS